MENRTICKLSMATIVTSIVAMIVLPVEYKLRGYLDVGGEWLFLIAIFTVVYKFSWR